MDHNIAAWMIAGGPRVETHADMRDREQLHAFRESQRIAHVGLIDRLRAIARPRAVDATIDLAPCAA